MPFAYFGIFLLVQVAITFASLPPPRDPVRVAALKGSFPKPSSQTKGPVDFDVIHRFLKPSNNDKVKNMGLQRNPPHQTRVFSTPKPKLVSKKSFVIERSNSVQHHSNDDNHREQIEISPVQRIPNYNRHPKEKDDELDGLTIETLNDFNQSRGILIGPNGLPIPQSLDTTEAKEDDLTFTTSEGKANITKPQAPITSKGVSSSRIEQILNQNPTPSQKPKPDYRKTRLSSPNPNMQPYFVTDSSRVEPKESVETRSPDICPRIAIEQVLIQKDEGKSVGYWIPFRLDGLFSSKPFVFKDIISSWDFLSVRESLHKLFPAVDPTSFQIFLCPTSQKQQTSSPLETNVHNNHSHHHSGECISIRSFLEGSFRILLFDNGQLHFINILGAIPKPEYEISVLVVDCTKGTISIVPQKKFPSSNTMDGWQQLSPSDRKKLVWERLCSVDFCTNAKSGLKLILLPKSLIELVRGKKDSILKTAQSSNRELYWYFYNLQKVSGQKTDLPIVVLEVASTIKNKSPKPGENSK